MAQFDIYRNPDPQSADTVPFLLNIQADCVDALPTMVLVPVVRPSSGVRPARHLNPMVAVEDEPLVLLTDQLAAVSRQVLGRPVGSLAGHRDEIIAALDFLITGV